ATYDEMGDLRLGLQLTEPGVGPEGDAPYALSPGEGVRVGFRGQTIPLVAGTDYVLGDGYYATITPGSPPTAEEPITLTFDRGGSDRVTLELDAPPDFVLSVPAASPQPVTISWAPIAAEPMHWYTSFDEGPIPHDTGSIEFPTSVVGVTAASDVDFAFTRTRTIVAKTALHSASATYTWEHSITVEVTP
ncbi:MAG TPA: hypothetical protein VLT45_08430, partial [Kofleriaceae bacterium]|nr:hypothetical protein [Kofleriaceae bacterium]